MELSFDRRVRMEFGFDRLPTDQREGGRDKFTVASAAPGNPPPPAPRRPLLPAHPYPRFFLSDFLYSIGNRISVGKRSFGYKTVVDETIYGVVKKMI
jgi:hypothetical protein